MNELDILPEDKPLKTRRKPVATTFQIHTKGLKTKLGEHIWHIKRIEKDLKASGKLHRRGSVLKEHARGIRPKHVGQKHVGQKKEK